MWKPSSLRVIRACRLETWLSGRAISQADSLPRTVMSRSSGNALPGVSPLSIFRQGMEVGSRSRDTDPGQTSSGSTMHVAFDAPDPSAPPFSHPEAPMSRVN
jgi:hypothetical protein